MAVKENPRKGSVRMRLEIEIPEAFEKHFNHDRFKESLERIMADIEYQSDIGVSLMSGNYEFETVEMLEKALNNGKVIKDVELEEQPTEESGYNAGYKDAFEETLATIKYYAHIWDGIYQCIDELEERWTEKSKEMESD